MSSKQQQLKVKRGYSTAEEPRAAVKELREQIDQPDMAGVILYCSSRYDLDQLGPEIERSFDCPVFGCTTAGELISETGYMTGGVVGASLSSQMLRMHTKLIWPLQEFGPSHGSAVVKNLKRNLELFHELDPAHMFALLLIDGMSMREEHVAAILFGALRGVHLIGGSAGDDLAFKQTHVYYEGRFRSDAAVLALVETHLPFKVFKNEHFSPTDTRLVITGADPDRRIVHEINGEPAAVGYASALETEVANLDPALFSARPVVVRVGGEYYVRSIQRANEDSSLSFYCAVDDGLVLRVAQAGDMVEQLQAQLDALDRELDEIPVIIGFDCILRRLEAISRGIEGDVLQTLGDRGFIGFSTYGEQLNALHINQTLTGVAIGGRA